MQELAQRRPAVATGLRVFEVDQPATQAGKIEAVRRLFGSVPEGVTYVPIDFNTELQPSFPNLIRIALKPVFTSDHLISTVSAVASHSRMSPLTSVALTKAELSSPTTLRMPGAMYAGAFNSPVDYGWNIAR